MATENIQITTFVREFFVRFFLVLLGVQIVHKKSDKVHTKIDNFIFM